MILNFTLKYYNELHDFVLFFIWSWHWILYFINDKRILEIAVF
jgi:hypothetical protein